MMILSFVLVPVLVLQVGRMRGWCWKCADSGLQYESGF